MFAKNTMPDSIQDFLSHLTNPYILIFMSVILCLIIRILNKFNYLTELERMNIININTLTPI